MSGQPQRVIFLGVWLLLGAGCATSRSIQGPVWRRTDLLFGLGRQGQPNVSEEAWRQFAEEEIARRFPAGFTVVPADGYWRGADGATRREPSRMVVIVHPAGLEEDRLVDEIRKIYAQRFTQESVLRLDAPLDAANVSFQPGRALPP
jgi:hypothetical protein